MNSHKEIKKRDFVYIIKSILRKQILSQIDLINTSNLRLRKSVLFLFDCFRIIILTLCLCFFVCVQESDHHSNEVLHSLRTLLSRKKRMSKQAFSSEAKSSKSKRLIRTKRSRQQTKKKKNDKNNNNQSDDDDEDVEEFHKLYIVMIFETLSTMSVMFAQTTF